MTREELKLRQMTNQYLISPAEKLTVVRDLCGVQAQFMANAIHSLRIRVSDFDTDTVADGLVKNWTIRGTVHVFAESDLPLFKHCNNGKDYRSLDFGGYMTWQKPDGSYAWSNEGGVCRRVYVLTPQRQRELSLMIIDAVNSGQKTREKLKEICRASGMTSIEEGCMFDGWGGGIRDLCERGFMNYVVQEEKAYIAAPEFEPIPEDRANLEIARRYFTNIAPATIHDAMYFFHATAAQVKAWLDELPVKSFVCEEKTYYYIENGKTYDKDIPKCVFLAGFDQLMLGYQKKESVYLKNEHLRGIFNLAGIVMPAILLRGNVVGRWQKKSGRIIFSLFESIDSHDRKIIENTAERYFDKIKKIEWQ